jgi:hypothetical protein
MFISALVFNENKKLIKKTTDIKKYFITNSLSLNSEKYYKKITQMHVKPDYKSFFDKIITI